MSGAFYPTTQQKIIVMKFSLSLPPRRGFVGCGIAALMAASFLSVASAQVTLISDTFDGSSVNTGLWANGSTGSLGITTVSGGSISLDVNRQDSARNGLLAHGTNFNPFEAPMTITLNGLSLGGTTNGSPIALYAAVGRLPTDLGGVATGALASTYSAGGGGYYSTGTGGVLGVSILKFNTGVHYLQVLDVGGSNGTGTVRNVFGNISLSGMPTDMTWVIDGANTQFTITLEGATFTGGPGSGTNTVTGSIDHFSETVLDTGSGIVSRFVIGANNTGATSITDGAIGTFGEVSVVSAIPEPSTYALIASAFICGVVVLRRRTRA